MSYFSKTVLQRSLTVSNVLLPNVSFPVKAQSDLLCVCLLCFNSLINVILLLLFIVNAQYHTSKRSNNKNNFVIHIAFFFVILT